jgi:prepilin-type N-terminal cleavage/methylation domain-containing protein
MKKGFTLVELLAVIAILSFITTLVLINAIHYANMRKQRDLENIISIAEENNILLEVGGNMLNVSGG